MGDPCDTHVKLIGDAWEPHESTTNPCEPQRKSHGSARGDPWKSHEKPTGDPLEHKISWKLHSRPMGNPRVSTVELW